MVVAVVEIFEIVNKLTGELMEELRAVVEGPVESFGGLAVVIQADMEKARDGIVGIAVVMEFAGGAIEILGDGLTEKIADAKAAEFVGVAFTEPGIEHNVECGGDDEAAKILEFFESSFGYWDGAILVEIKVLVHS